MRLKGTLSPGSSLTTVVSLVPPTVQHLAAQVSEWLHTHHGAGVMAAGDVCLFAYLPDHVGTHFAGAVQFVRGHPFFRLVSRGALHYTPADRLRFLTFETDAANTAAIPLATDTASSSRSVGPGDGEASQEEVEDASTGYSLLQRSARVVRGTLFPSACDGCASSQPEGPTPLWRRLRLSPLLCEIGPPLSLRALLLSVPEQLPAFLAMTLAGRMSHALPCTTVPPLLLFPPLQCSVRGALLPSLACLCSETASLVWVQPWAPARRIGPLGSMQAMRRPWRTGPRLTMCIPTALLKEAELDGGPF